MTPTGNWLIQLDGSEFKVMRLQDAARPEHTGDTPETIVAHLRSQLANSIAYNPDTESLMVVLLNARRKIIGWQIIATGTLDTLLFHPREVFKPAIICNAQALVLAHNHPSGDPGPSEADVKMTRDMIRAGQLLRIEVLDHIILGACSSERAKSYSSMRELGYFYA